MSAWDLSNVICCAPKAEHSQHSNQINSQQILKNPWARQLLTRVNKQKRFQVALLAM